MEGDRLKVCKKCKQMIISTHALTWRATIAAILQNMPGWISTHALTWRATYVDDWMEVQNGISTHALTWRATVLLQTPSVPYKDFYPRPHMEGDDFQARIPIARMISTHALTWRATRYGRYSTSTIVISTHALTWRATRRLLGNQHQVCISTHALTWRATGALAGMSIMYRHFYPRPHMEGDTVPPVVYPAGTISTHALTWRATHCADHLAQLLRISTHALTWRATHQSVYPH